MESDAAKVQPERFILEQNFMTIVYQKFYLNQDT